jgi:hypothetical protein
VILFWGALAASFVLAFALWAQGQWNAPFRDPYKIGSLVVSLLWLTLSFAMLYSAWRQFSYIIDGMQAGEILSRYVEKAKDARYDLACWSAITAMTLLGAAKAAGETTNLFTQRKARTKAKPEEIHA